VKVGDLVQLSPHFMVDIVYPERGVYENSLGIITRVIHEDGIYKFRIEWLPAHHGPWYLLYSDELIVATAS